MTVKSIFTVLIKLEFLNLKIKLENKKIYKPHEEWIKNLIPNYQLLRTSKLSEKQSFSFIYISEQPG